MLVYAQTVNTGIRSFVLCRSAGIFPAYMAMTDIMLKHKCLATASALHMTDQDIFFPLFLLQDGCPAIQRHRSRTEKYWHHAEKPASAKAVDNAVRKGLRQIQDNPGGIILNFKKNAINLPEVKKLIEDRLRRGFPASVDFIIVSQNTVAAVYRFKK